MDRFSYDYHDKYEVYPNERYLALQNFVKVFDGEKKTPGAVGAGDLQLTTHRLIWENMQDFATPGAKEPISLTLSQIAYMEMQPSRFQKIGTELIVHLHVKQPDQRPGPVKHSPNSYVKLAYKHGSATDFYQCFREALRLRLWEPLQSPTGTVQASGQPAAVGRARTGIVGIERTLQERQKEASKNISKAFEDLNKLMAMAKDMVSLAKVISTKIKEKQGDISEDETIQFKSYLLSLGIDDPVTRGTHGSQASFHRELARELANFIEQPLKEVGSVMALTDVYCRMNRARGLELLSPEDLLNACKMLDILNLPIRLHVFDSGVMVLQLRSHNEEELITQTTQLLEDKGSLTAEELSQHIGLSVVLAKERLLSTEKLGGACRDDSIEGLRFYPNWFATRPSIACD